MAQKVCYTLFTIALLAALLICRRDATPDGLSRFCAEIEREHWSYACQIYREQLSADPQLARQAANCVQRKLSCALADPTGKASRAQLYYLLREAERAQLLSHQLLEEGCQTLGLPPGR